jgi:transposase-like protein
MNPSKQRLKEQCKKALIELLIHFGGSKAEMARQAGVARNTVSYWFTRGQVGRESARKYGRMRTIPFTKEQLRPDIQNWQSMAERKGQG